MAKSKPTKRESKVDIEVLVDGQQSDGWKDSSRSMSAAPNAARNAVPLPPQRIKRDPAKQGLLISKLRHPVTISYEGMAAIIPPLGRIPVPNREMVGALPKGVLLR